MKLGKLRPALTAGLLGVGAMTPAGTWARPDPDPNPPPGWVAETPDARTQAPPGIPGGLDFLTPGVDALILALLLGWLWMMVRRRRNEENLLATSYYEKFSPEHGPLRRVASPSKAHAESLRRYRPQWVAEFKSLQDAWAQHDLRPVSGIIAPEIRNELELSPSASSAATLPQIQIEQADPADSWKENGNEFVTVHFSGKLKEPSAKAAKEFDEYWTFFRKLSAFETGTGSLSGVAADDAPWIVASIRRGNRERSLPRLAHRG